MSGIGVVRETRTSTSTKCSEWIDAHEALAHEHNIVPQSDIYIWSPFSSLAGSASETSCISMVNESDQLAIYAKCNTKEAVQAAMTFFGKFKRHESSDLDQRELESKLLEHIDILLTRRSLTERDFIVP